MVDISSKSLRMVIDFPYYLKYDKSQDLRVYYSAIINELMNLKWRNMKISTSTLFYMYTRFLRNFCGRYLVDKVLCGRYLVDIRVFFLVVDIR